VTGPSAEKRVRTRCQATTKLGVQCRATAVERGLCSVHSGRIDVRAIGAKGGRARKRKGKGSLRDSIRRLLSEDPDRYAAQLLSSGAKGLELADKFIAEEDARVEQERAPVDPELFRPVDFEGMANIFRETGQLHFLAIYPRVVAEPMLAYLTPSELEIVHHGDEQAARGGGGGARG
jgi:hypothetical protein